MAGGGRGKMMGALGPKAEGRTVVGRVLRLAWVINAEGAL